MPAPSFRWTTIPLLLILLICQLGLCLKSLPNSLAGNVDFRVFYASGHLVAHGQGSQLYDLSIQHQVQNTLVGPASRTLPFLYPAYAALLFVPLSLLPYKSAFLFFLFINLALLFLTASLLRSHLNPPQPAWLLALLFLTLLPVSIALMQGQVTFLLLLVYTACFKAQQTHRPVLAGFLLSVTLIKFQLTLPIALLFLLWRLPSKLRLLTGFATGTIVLTAISLAITGQQGSEQYLASLLHITQKTLLTPQQAHQQYGMFPADMPNLHGLLFVLTNNTAIARPLLILASALVFLWAAHQRPTPSASLSIALPTAMLISYHLQPYDLTLLLLPLTLAVTSWHASSENRSAQSHRRRSTILAIAILTTPIAPLLLLHSLCSLQVIAIASTLAMQHTKRKGAILHSRTAPFSLL